jgi:hypothetical protein
METSLPTCIDIERCGNYYAGMQIDVTMQYTGPNILPRTALLGWWQPVRLSNGCLSGVVHRTLLTPP